MSQTFKCPSCSAPLDYKGGELTVRCPYCNASVIVPAELRMAADGESEQQAEAGAPRTLGQLAEFVEIGRLVKAGQKIEAIKLYRQVTGVGLKEAKDAVEALAAGREVEVSRYTVSVQPPGMPPEMLSRAEQIAKIGRLLQGGNKIEAIKVYRETFGVGLKEAKEAVDKLETTVGTPGAFDLHPPVVIPREPRAPRGAAPEKPRASSFGLALIVGLILLVLAGLGLAGGPQKLAALAGLGPTATPTRIIEPTRSMPVPTAAPTYTPAPTSTPTLDERAQILLGCMGQGRGCFEDARSLGMDGEGNIYVGEYSGGKVQVFDRTGKFLAQWRLGDEDTILRRMAVSRQGLVYAVSGGNIYLVEGMTGELVGQLEYEGGRGFQDAVLGADGQLVATWNRDWQGGMFVNFSESQDDVVIFDREGKVLQVIPKALSDVAGGDPELDTSVAVDDDGYIYLSGMLNPGIYKFSPEGKFVDKFAEQEAEYVRAMAVDRQGRLFISAFGDLMVFDSKGRYLGMIDFSAEGITFTDEGHLLILDSPQVIEITLRGEP